MSRGLNKSFLEDLKRGILKPVLERTQRDHSLDFQIRNNEVHIYYRGGKLIGISPKSPSYEVSFDKNYLKDFDETIELVPIVSDLTGAEECVSQFQTLKLAMDYRFSRKRKAEREFQQLISRENSYSSISNNTDYFIVDVEFERTVGDMTTKLDAVAIKWPSTSSARKLANNFKPKLAIVEVKYGDSSLKGNAGIVDHLQKTYSCLNTPEVLEGITSTVLTQFNQKRELGLVLFAKGGNSNGLTELDGRPEFIFLLANHDPASSTLATELDSSPFKEAYDMLLEHADVRFATSSFMGYGLYDECILDLVEFKTMLTKQVTRCR